MGELTIRRNRGFAVPQYQGTGKAEKKAGTSASQKVNRATVTLSGTLQQLMSRFSQAEGQVRESRRTLQTGEAVLAEVRDSLNRIGALAQEAAGGGSSDRAALQAQLEQLRDNIDRIINSASAGGVSLFLDEEAGPEAEMDSLLSAIMKEAAGDQEGLQQLPNWLIQGITQDAPTPEQLLAALGLDKNASGPELLAAIANRSLEHDPAAGYLASLYLGTVIAGGDPSQGVDPQQAFEGLQQLMEKVSEGVPLDQAIEELTGGEFSSLADFQSQFNSGTAPGLQDFLVNLLLSDSGAAPLPGSPLLALLAGMEGMNFDLLMGLLSAAQSPQAGPAAGEPDTAAQAASSPVLSQPAAEKGPVTVVQMGGFQVMGRDLSAVSFQPGTGVLTISGQADVAVQGTAQGGILLTGSGTVTLQGVSTPLLTVESPAARILTTGENALEQLHVREGSTLTLGGRGLLRIDVFRALLTGGLRLTGGAVVVTRQEGEAPGVLSAPVVLEGAAVLAAQASQVTTPSGKAPEPFDLVWKTLLPGWHSLTSVAVDGQQTKLALLHSDPARLWLDKGDSNHGYPIHTLFFQGRDEAGRLQARYAYLRWNQRSKSFQEVDMYPNPFAVTGGEAGQDWVYEEESHTLRILSDQVTALSGGTGTDGNDAPFSGRIILSDHIGALTLALDGVVCRVAAGPAFRLGQGNQITLLLQRGTSSHFESGPGYAGISLGDGTCLNINCTSPQGGAPVGILTASGGEGGAGIGRDRSSSRDQVSQISILGGAITASGTGGGAGIGGALGARMGDISIHGGSITAVSTGHAAAIGAGVRGDCGDILITGTARIVKAQGGSPGADIGACLFGGCGNVLISGGADIGTAQLWRRTGIPLQMGAETVILPRFRLSNRILRLSRMSLFSQETAQDTKRTIDEDCLWVAQIQEAYQTLYSQLERNSSSLRGAPQYLGAAPELIRDTDAASSLLNDMRLQLSTDQALRSHSRRGTDGLEHLLQS